MKRLMMTHKLAAVMTVGVLMSEAGSAFAQQSFKEVTQNITTSTSTLPNLISTVAYVGGIGLGVAGIFKLKSHVDAPAQNPMKDGLARLGAGGGLLALPYLTESMTGTVGTGGTAPPVAKFNMTF